MIYKNCYLKPGMPEMKSHALSLGLADSILKHGGDIWYNCEVSKILIEDGRAAGVIADGKELRADIRSRCIRLHTAHSKKLGDLSTKKPLPLDTNDRKLKIDERREIRIYCRKHRCNGGSGYAVSEGQTWGSGFCARLRVHEIYADGGKYRLGKGGNGADGGLQAGRQLL
jgi:transketolase C-terminal domain/subunit